MINLRFNQLKLKRFTGCYKLIIDFGKKSHLTTCSKPFCHSKKSTYWRGTKTCPAVPDCPTIEKGSCVLLHEALNACKNIVIDDTNLTKDIRAQHISTAQPYGGIVRAVHFTNTSQAINYNRKRMRRLDDSVIYGHVTKKSAPTRNEGFDYIQQMPGWFYYIGNTGNLVGKMARASQC